MSEEAIPLDRAGNFQAKPVAWNIQTGKEGSKSVAIGITFIVAAQWEKDAWTSWAEYEPMTVRGYWYVIGKDGKVNQTAVKQLRKSMGWDGDLQAVAAGDPPGMIVQLNVKANKYNDEITYRAEWMSPEGEVPGAFGASPEEVNALQSQFGSLLRAAASAIPAPAKAAPPAAPAAAKAAAPPKSKAAPAPKTAEAPISDEAKPY